MNVTLSGNFQLRWSNTGLGRALNLMTGALIRKRDWKSETSHEEQDHMMMKAKIRVREQHSKEPWRLPATTRNQEEARGDSFLQTSEEVWPCQHFDVRLPASRMWKDKFLLFQTTQLVAPCYGNHRRLIHSHGGDWVINPIFHPSLYTSSPWLLHGHSVFPHALTIRLAMWLTLKNDKGEEVNTPQLPARP